MFSVRKVTRAWVRNRSPVKPVKPENLRKERISMHVRAQPCRLDGICNKVTIDECRALFVACCCPSLTYHAPQYDIISSYYEHIIQDIICFSPSRHTILLVVKSCLSTARPSPIAQLRTREVVPFLKLASAHPSHLWIGQSASERLARHSWFIKRYCFWF